ncbi:MAG: hypothetical protein H0X38_05310 [Planctomycetes bacterium]|nr:hypothetical protein [Planctomycetota bacterium]
MAKCSIYRIDPPSLVAALTDEDVLARYQANISDEIPSLADRPLIAHLKRMSTSASRAQADGFDRFAEADPAAADSLLSDLFAVATYHRWPLPAQYLGEEEMPVDGIPRGLLGADTAPEGARLWQIDDETIALARSREAADSADMSGHAKAEGDEGADCGPGCGQH